MARDSREIGLDLKRAAEILDSNWKTVVAEAARNPSLSYVTNVAIRQAIHASVNHNQVAYRFCLPIQLLGKMTQPSLDCLRLQKRKDDISDRTGWDARSLGSKVVARFNQREEYILGTSGDPYVGNPMRIPRMVRDDPSKKQITGWNVLVSVLEEVESRNDSAFTTSL